jgi:trk system potassium uptake protein TrkH
VARAAVAPVAPAAREARHSAAQRWELLAPLLLLVVAALGAADFALATRGSVSLSLCALLTATAVPWAILVLRRRGATIAASGSARTGRLLVIHLANLALVLAFLAAKWLSALRVLGHEGTAYLGSYRTYTAAVVVLLVLGVALRTGRVARFVAASADHPAQLMAMSFGLTGILGGLLLSLPFCIRRVTEVSLFDSVFMSISAVCITGLTTVNVAETYTFAGQVVLCVLMQAGGLGIMALTAAVTILAGRRLDMKSTAVMAELVDARSLADLKRTLLVIVSYTLLFEAIGAGLLYIELAAITDGADDARLAGAGSLVWAAVFHAVSAFCNCGLSNFQSGMLPFAHVPAVCQTMAVLILVGGLGFPVIHELIFRVADRLAARRAHRLTLNTRISLATSAILFASMAIAYLALERPASFSALGTAERVNAAVFQSASARSAGFNLVDVAAMRPATLLLTIIAMFIGANPGSTGGGIKTTTVAVLFAAYRGDLRGQRPRQWGRTIPEAVVRRATGVAFLSIGLVTSVVFLLLLLEPHDPMALTFEAVSAFSTTGLSTGITPSLSSAAKMLLVVTMLVGRVGPLTLALALSGRARLPTYELPEERVMIG